MKNQPTYDLIRQYARLMALIGAASHTLFYLVLVYGIGYQDSLMLRLTSAALISSWWFLSADKTWSWRQRLYYELTATIVFPIFFTYLLLLNNVNTYWFGSAVFAGMLMGLLSRPVVAICGYVIGAMAATFCFSQIHSLDQHLLQASLQAHLAAFFLLLIATGIQKVFNKAYLELDYLKQEAERANSSKSKFLAAASHDLRQPLHALGLYLDTITRELSSERQLELASKMSIAVDALKDLFQRLLDISKLDAGIVEPNIVDYPIDSLFNRLAIRFTPHAESKLLKLVLKNDKQIINTDPVLLERIMDNLIVNAIRNSENGSISINATTDEENVVITVSDTGRGIPKEELENIFVEFHQLDNPERDRSKGLGLGLSIVKRLCALLNYRLELDSVVGKGTTFHLYIPKGNPGNMPKFINVPQRMLWDIGDMHILVIDDETGIRDAMRELLTGWNCKVTCADSAEEALEKITIDSQLDLIIADYRLRGSKNGVEAIQLISQHLNRDLPGMIITGDTAPERLQEASKSGYKLLHKPLNAGQLRVAVNHLLNQNQRQLV